MKIVLIDEDGKKTKEYEVETITSPYPDPTSSDDEYLVLLHCPPLMKFYIKGKLREGE